MGTRGIIGLAHDGGFSGRYVHQDSYPSGLGPELLETYRQLDGDWREVLGHATRPDEQGYWSSYGTPDVVADGTHCWQEAEGEVLLSNNDDQGAEWAYLLDERGINVVAAMRDTGRKAVGAFGSIGDIVWESVGKVAWTDTDVDWKRLECGQDFERCTHYAWVHFPEAKDVRVSTDVWLGRTPPGSHDLIALVHPRTGRRLALTGGGNTGTSRSGGMYAMREIMFDHQRPRYWWARVEGGPADGVRMGRQIKAGLKLEWDGVAVIASGEVVVPAGTVVRG